MKDKVFNTANILSLSRIVFGLIFIILFFQINNPSITHSGKLILEIVSTLIFIIAIVTDALDGYYARKEDNVTNLGKHLDPLTDSIFFIIVFYSFVHLGLMRWYLFAVVTARELFMHLFLRPYYKKKGIYLSASIYGKLKTVLQSVFSLTLLAFLMFREIMLYFLNSMNKFYIVYDFYLKLSGDVFFGIITFISLLSLAIYIKNFLKLLVKKS